MIRSKALPILFLLFLCSASALASEKFFPILDAPVKRFEIDKATPKEFRRALLDTPEFVSYREKNDLLSKLPNDPYGYIISGSFGRRETENLITLDLEDTTLRKIFNAAVSQRNDGSVWTYDEWEVKHEGKTYALFRFGGFLSGYWEISE